MCQRYFFYMCGSVVLRLCVQLFVALCCVHGVSMCVSGVGVHGVFDAIRKRHHVFKKFSKRCCRATESLIRSFFLLIPSSRVTGSGTSIVAGVRRPFVPCSRWLLPAHLFLVARVH